MTPTELIRLIAPLNTDKTEIDGKEVEPAFWAQAATAELARALCACESVGVEVVP